MTLIRIVHPFHSSWQYPIPKQNLFLAWILRVSKTLFTVIVITLREEILVKKFGRFGGFYEKPQ